ncbi:MerR family transcriptional regulator [Saccharopolyspora hordei]|uniref:DNA-binding transcriptional MerR regulator n=1 Tax=Saccharopolyspora hordei TaxID=1838 RepID=A0A853AIB4_9PSEU|nr:MerR family transcriptional regulator [Saccharopolyspora hordei]NYI83546.1 DNA-binding transcriptional MerR regulator [Saccharopolyspora hordei]
MDDTSLSIGSFARQTGLTPSALRFYDDCGVLPPAHVDEATGYRYYSPTQVSRAVLLRRLRTAGVPLAEVGVVLDGPAEQARAVLTAHARRAQDAAAATRSAIAEVLRSLPGGQRVRVGGAELASAVRQVAPSIAAPTVQRKYPVLGCVLVELDDHEVRLVATDRYRLAVRTLRPVSAEGGATRLAVDAAELTDAASWALPLAEVEIEVDDSGARLRSDDQTRPLTTSEETFPDYRLILDDLPSPQNRVVTDRSALRTALLDTEGPVALRTAGDQLVVTDRGGAESRLPAVHSGAELTVSVRPTVLVPALEAGVGPDVLLEVAAPDLPVVVRSADQGSFTTLVMPVRPGA